MVAGAARAARARGHRAGVQERHVGAKHQAGGGGAVTPVDLGVLRVARGVGVVGPHLAGEMPERTAGGNLEGDAIAAGDGPAQRAGEGERPARERRAPAERVAGRQRERAGAGFHKPAGARERGRDRARIGDGERRCGERAGAGDLAGGERERAEGLVERAEGECAAGDRQRAGVGEAIARAEGDRAVGDRQDAGVGTHTAQRLIAGANLRVVAGVARVIGQDAGEGAGAIGDAEDEALVVAAAVSRGDLAGTRQRIDAHVCLDAVKGRARRHAEAGLIVRPDLVAVRAAEDAARLHVDERAGRHLEGGAAPAPVGGVRPGLHEIARAGKSGGREVAIRRGDVELERRASGDGEGGRCAVPAEHEPAAVDGRGAGVGIVGAQRQGAAAGFGNAVGAADHAAESEGGGAIPGESDRVRKRHGRVHGVAHGGCAGAVVGVEVHHGSHVDGRVPEVQRPAGDGDGDGRAGGGGAAATQGKGVEQEGRAEVVRAGVGEGDAGEIARRPEDQSRFARADRRGAPGRSRRPLVGERVRRCVGVIKGLGSDRKSEQRERRAEAARGGREQRRG